ncbi:hypothetical protein H0H92_015811 [Tricholoma furcatifolium]|nr:hypothetical protein H0H92_015811 [Tricholoma furcatifolium]
MDAFQLPSLTVPGTTLEVDNDSSDTIIVTTASSLVEDKNTQVSSEFTEHIDQVSDALLHIFADLELYKRFLEYRLDEAEEILDLLQQYLDYFTIPQSRKCFYIALVRLCRKSKRFPRCYIMDKDGLIGKPNNAETGGPRGDIYKGWFQNDRGEKVQDLCLKRLKILRSQGQDHVAYESRKEEYRKAFAREAVTWGQLKHPNILPFLGIHRPEAKGGDPGVYLVSPWIKDKDIHSYLTSEQTSAFLRQNFIYGIAAGLKYLHDNGVVHGNLKCSNILLASPQQAVITDFGFSYVWNAAGVNNRDGVEVSSRRHVAGGSADFTAPEHYGNQENRTFASDVYNFGLVCYQIYTTPYIPGVHDVQSVQDWILNRNYDGVIQRPQRPEIKDRGLTDEMWELILRCLSKVPGDRPTATQIVQTLPVDNLTVDERWDHPSQIRKSFQTAQKHDPTIIKAYRLLRRDFGTEEWFPILTLTTTENSSHKPSESTSKKILKSLNPGLPKIFKRKPSEP